MTEEKVAEPGEPARGVHDDPQRHLRREPSALFGRRDQHVGERAAFDERHDHQQLAVRFVDVDDTDGAPTSDARGEARLGVAVQGLAQSEVAYQNAVNYARERLQGRSISGTKAPDKPADPIIVHPDVRRTLLTIRAFNEAARAMVVWTSLKSDVAHRSSDPKDRQEADDHMGLMTPVMKGVMTDTGFANTVLAQQMFGGHGYIAEHGMEQFVRDARIGMIYEGTNHVQALDLVGRSSPRGRGGCCSATRPSSPRSSRRRGRSLHSRRTSPRSPRRRGRCRRRPSSSPSARRPTPTRPAPRRASTCTCSATWR